jgi:hypothetical protein
MAEPAFYVCPPTVPKRFPGTKVGRCQLCRAAVQYKPGGPEAAERHHGRAVIMICVPCALKDMPVGNKTIQ